MYDIRPFRGCITKHFWKSVVILNLETVSNNSQSNVCMSTFKYPFNIKDSTLDRKIGLQPDYFLKVMVLKAQMNDHIFKSQPFQVNVPYCFYLLLRFKPTKDLGWVYIIYFKNLKKKLFNVYMATFKPIKFSYGTGYTSIITGYMCMPYCIIV